MADQPDLPESKEGLKEFALRAYRKAKNMSQAGAAIAGQVLQTAEVMAGAFGIGYARMRWGTREGDLQIAGVDVDLGGGFLGHVIGYLGVAGGYGEHVHNLSDGLLASWANTKGMQLGAEHASDDGTTSTTSGRLSGRRPSVMARDVRQAVSAR